MSPVVLAGLAFGLSQVALGLLLLVRAGNWGASERLYFLFMLAVGAYLLSPLLVETGAALLAGTVATAVPGLFWLLSASIFDDHFRLRAWQAGLVATTVCLPLAGDFLKAEGALYWLLFSLPQLLEFVLLGLALWEVATVPASRAAPVSTSSGDSR